MNTIGIDHNLDRAQIRKLLAIGLFASVLTGIGIFLEGLSCFAVYRLMADAAPKYAHLFGGLLAAMPSAEQFTTFESPLRQPSEG